MGSDQPIQLNLDFVKKLAHDVKGPVGNTAMFSQLLEEKMNMLDSEDLEEAGIDISQFKELSNTIVHINKKLLTQLQCWVDAFEIKHGNFQYEAQRVKAGEVVDEIKELNRIYLDKKNIELEDIHVDRDTEFIINKDLLFQILDQLISLSITFGEQNSSIQIKGESNESFYKFSVIDQYEGARDNIIERYTENIESIDTLMPEEGILKPAAFGMIFINLAVDMTGGEKGVDQNPDDATTTFWFTIPLS